MALPVVEGLVGLVAVTVLLSSILAPPTVAYAHLSLALPADVQGTALGSIRTGFVLLVAASPWIVGSLPSGGLFVEAFWLLAASSASATLCGFVPEI